MEEKPRVLIHVCTSQDMHPYACEGSPCIHCEGKVTDTHDPNTCALCHDYGF